MQKLLGSKNSTVSHKISVWQVELKKKKKSHSFLHLLLSREERWNFFSTPGIWAGFVTYLDQQNGRRHTELAWCGPQEALHMSSFSLGAQPHTQADLLGRPWGSKISHCARWMILNESTSIILATDPGTMSEPNRAHQSKHNPQMHGWINGACCKPPSSGCLIVQFLYLEGERIEPNDLSVCFQTYLFCGSGEPRQRDCTRKSRL